MGWYFWAPAIPFAILLFTPLRWPTILATAAGVAAGMAVASTFAMAWPLFSMALLLNLVMALAEGIAASLFSRGKQVPSVTAAFAAHGFLVYMLWRDLAHGRWALAIFLIPAAMLGGSAASLGAWLSRRA